MTTAAPLPLRERKKAETWGALHESAASLALQHGVDETTVEAIAASAGVSPRTFFNYFHVKEDAILGLREPVLEPAQLSRISVTADDLVGQISRLLVTVAWTAIGGTDRARRRQLIARYPNLARRHMDYMVKAERLVSQGISGLLAQDPVWAAGAEGFGPEEAARMLVMIAGVPIRFNITSADFDPVEGISAETLGPSLTLLHDLLRKIS
ncbi:TetR/AcrR family transcriptional regulator [Arthrobacter sp. PsM3]|uniref:TetR/AcrR family transcriptional regulator n=1 Tax=Arthrobacter sp. PsM3 TaxID=3030531 RepID=UPI00263B98E8|nr:TetR/AcrR family transcriptional regulator [Arthrobacter sp. PsM3]MDN4645005.1 helix-turn-helix domain containing protein [Arthrobacter sp. PsM3]